MLQNNDRYPLQEIIIEDLFTSNKLVLILLFAITASALGTVWITHQTRGLVAEKGELVLQHQALEMSFKFKIMKKRHSAIHENRSHCQTIRYATCHIRARSRYS